MTSLGGFFGHASLAGASLEGAGLVGLLRALRPEHPALRIKAIDVDPWSLADEIARTLLAELDGACPKLWAGWFRGERRVPALVPMPAPEIDADRLAALRQVPYVLVTGGARGITAELAVRLAELGVRRLHLVGRTPLPADLRAGGRSPLRGSSRERVLEELAPRAARSAPRSGSAASRGSRRRSRSIATSSRLEALGARSATTPPT